jgi:hypothetical protein
MKRREFMMATLAPAFPLAGRAAPAPRRVVCFQCGGARLAPALADLAWRQGTNLELTPKILPDAATQEQPTHAEVILNRRVAAAIGVTFPPELLMRATQIIE